MGVGPAQGLYICNVIYSVSSPFLGEGKRGFDLAGDNAGGRVKVYSHGGRMLSVFNEFQFNPYPCEQWAFSRRYGST